ncbi:hypothetical protein ACFPTO_24235 [Paraburkholderia denitrificans]|uniref:Uncharacterized protein n=1 Tax=Paraburkholderia denitrificans TaxID=694025 RepID=A0ABW0JF96_9BURK
MASTAKYGYPECSTNTTQKNDMGRIPYAVLSAETAVVSGVTFAVTGAPSAVLALATTEYSVPDTPDGSVAVIRSGALSPARETL